MGVCVGNILIFFDFVNVTEISLFIIIYEVDAVDRPCISSTVKWWSSQNKIAEVFFSTVLYGLCCPNPNLNSPPS